ncbi:Origin recognition complex (ORC) subunit 4 C-terminus [Rhizoctonia solani]|uniref:Origin recognition complex (ORC) subunit 4 C-terminus n=1 Tax=Rhizoctonia solani TaxID=456999 RepID=A0A8H7IET7_9AGAM|nr:Origin recognition complex (ORC) subunit 4 C-terminus [Rhizoctonia solani]
MLSNKRKFDAVTPVKATSGRSTSVSSRGSYRTRPESDNDDEEERVESPEIISKKPKLFSTPSKSGRGKKKQTHANTEVDEIDSILHPESPGPTPSKTPRTKGGKTPRTVKKAASNITVVSRPNDSDELHQANERQTHLIWMQLQELTLPGASSKSSPLKPAIPGAARGRKKVPTRQLVRGDSGAQSSSAEETLGSTLHSGSASGSSAANTDEEELVPISSRMFANLKSGTTPKKALSSSRKLHESPNKQTLANGDVYVDYMGAYISSSAEENEEPRSYAKGRNLFGRTDSYSLASRQPPNASRDASLSRHPSLSSYDPSSPYTSRGPSPSPSLSFPNSQFPSESETEESDSESIYSHQQHVDPTRHLDKLASLARMALASAEDMRKKGIMREDEAPLPKCFLTGKKYKAEASETEGDDGDEPTTIRAIPERRLGQVEGEPIARSRSWMDTVLGPSTSQSGISRQSSSSSVATDLDNPFDNSHTPFRRTNSQPTLPISVPKRPDLAKGLPSAQSEPALETVLAAYDMTPSRARTIHMTPSKTRLVATPSHMRLFGSPSKRSRMREVQEVEEEIEERPIDQGFAAWLSKQQMAVLRTLRNPPWAPTQHKNSPEGPQSADEATFEVSVDGENNEIEAVIKLRALLHRTVETGKEIVAYWWDQGGAARQEYVCALFGSSVLTKIAMQTVLRALRTLNQSSRSQSQTRTSTSPSSPTKPTKEKQGGHTTRKPVAPPSTAAAPIVIHLSGHAQINDRLAMREIARQLVLQSGEALDVPLDEEEDPDEGPTGIHVVTRCYAPSQIVGALARQIRPVIVVLDAFDLFAEHARQALLYCLLDTVQSCRAGQGSQGLAVVGVTSRIDCLTMLEKRVKSRFSHRIIRVCPPSTVDSYVSLMMSALAVSARPDRRQLPATPKKKRDLASTAAQTDSCVYKLERFASRCEVTPTHPGAVASLTPSSPWLTVGTISRSIQSQCAPLPFVFLQELAYPCVALLVATQHIHDRGHDVFTFKMLCDEIKRELGNEAVTKALVQVQGRGLGLIRVPESVLETAFERLVAHNVVVLAGPGSSSTGRTYVKYRCVPDRPDIKEAVERLGHSAMKRWFVQGASS